MSEKTREEPQLDDSTYAHNLEIESTHILIIDIVSRGKLWVTLSLDIFFYLSGFLVRRYVLNF